MRGIVLALALALAAALLAGCSSAPVAEPETIVQPAPPAPSELDRCRGDLDEAKSGRNSLEKKNSILIETNARLSMQLEADKLKQVKEEVSLRARLSECDFRIRELEDELADYTTDSSTLQKEVIAAKKDLKTAEAETQSLKDALDALRAAKASLEEDLRKSRAETGALRADLEIARADARRTDPAEELAKSAFDKYSAALGAELRNDVLEIGRQGHVVRLTIPNKTLFKPSSNELEKDGEALLASIAAALKSGQGMHFRVEGHSDNVPIGASLRKTYPTNWELSVLRATAVARFITESQGLDPSLVGAAGYSEFRPVVSNKTNVGKAKNRRIEIIAVPATTDTSLAVED